MRYALLFPALALTLFLGVRVESAARRLPDDTLSSDPQASQRISQAILKYSGGGGGRRSSLLRTASAPSRFPAGKCTNINLLMDLPEPAARNSVIDQIRSNGITTIRVPLDLDHKTGLESPYEVDPRYLAEVADMARYASGHGMNVILDFARYKDLKQDPANNLDRFLAIWEQAARAWQGLPRSVMFEVFNEPRGQLNAKRYADLLDRAIPLIRRSNRDRILIIDSPGAAHYKGLAKLRLPADDPNLVPSFHYYDPMPYSHQGMKGADGAKRGAANFGSPDNIQKFDQAISAVHAYIAREGRVPFLGEFGATNEGGAERRKQYMTLVAQGFASIGVQSCPWTWDYGRQAFTVQKDGKILSGLSDAFVSVQ